MLDEDTLVRTVKNICRNRTAVQVIGALNRAKHVDSFAVTTMPVGQGPKKVELHYFRLHGWFITNSRLTREYKSRGLTPDPLAQAEDNKQDPAFADKHPNSTQWRLPNGRYYFLIFFGWLDIFHVSCSRRFLGWGSYWWFAGVRKP